MCGPSARRGTPRVVALAATGLLAISTLASCTSTQRTGTNFCRRLAESLPAIGEPMATQGDIIEQVTRYERLLEVAPLSIEEDLTVLTRLIRQASEVDAGNPDELQALADAAYAADRSADAVAAWTISTCAVDISTGMRVDPPRLPPVTTTTTAPPEATTPPVASSQDSTPEAAPDTTTGSTTDSTAVPSG